MRKKLFILLILFAIILTVFFTYRLTNYNNTAHASIKTSPTYLPVATLWKDTSKPINSIVNSIHSAQIKNGWVVAAIPNEALIVSSPAENSDPRYPDGLYIINATSSKVTALFQLNANKNEQINNAAADQKWIVYELGTDSGSQNTWSLYSYNLVTKKSYKIYSIPNGFGGPDEPSGLYVEGDQCFWSNYIQSDTSNEIISEIHDYNLAAQKDDILFHSTTNVLNQHDYTSGIIYSSSVGGGKVVFSLFDGVNPMDTSPAGDIYEIDLVTKQTSHLLHLYHCANPICSYGDQIVIDTNYNQAPNGPDNAAPYPVYLYSKGDKSIYQLSPDRNVYFPTQNERFIAWQGDFADIPQVYDLKTGTYFTVPGISAMITNGYITWSTPQDGMLYWAQLPN